MATLRELKGRIGSVASSEKITGAMKMISSAKMHKAEGVLRRLVPFGDCVRTIIASLLSSDAPVSSPLAQPRDSVSRIALVVFGSDEGLCGAYNVNTFKNVLDTIAALRKQYGDGVEFEIIPLGKKMAKAFGRLSDNRLKVAVPDAVTSKSEGDDVKDFAEKLQEFFLTGVYDRVELVYMHFHSAGRQRYTAESYLPVATDGLVSGKGAGRPCLFEPSAGAIFEAVLPMYLLSRIQTAFAENRASEQAARVMAMQSANDNAHKLLDQLQLEYNKQRQAGITTELLDIVGGQARD